jgi:hypothetical protein
VLLRLRELRVRRETGAGLATINEIFGNYLLDSASVWSRRRGVFGRIRGVLWGIWEAERGIRGVKYIIPYILKGAEILVSYIERCGILHIVYTAVFLHSFHKILWFFDVPLSTPSSIA